MPNAGQNWVVLWLFWPKTHVSVVIQCCYTISKSSFMLYRFDVRDRSHRRISSPTVPFSTKPTPNMGHNWVVLWLLWPKPYGCIVLGWCYTILKPILVHEKSLWSMGREAYMNLWFNLNLFYQADPQIGAKSSSFVTVLTKNISVHDCRLM